MTLFEGFDRESLRIGLREVVQQARDARIGPIVIRIVGGAALQLVFFERDITGDVDASMSPVGELHDIAVAVANQHGWPDTWLNDQVARAGYLPDRGRPIEWITLFDDDQALVQVAPADVLLAMKLRAFDDRRTRDLGDVIDLMAMSGITTITGVVDAVHDYFPDATLSSSAIDILAFHLGRGLPPAPPSLDELAW
jgi:hypothetical protein